MREHEVPTHVQAEDKVLLWFTFPQIVAMTAVCAISYGAYRYAPVGPSEVRMALAVLLGLAGTAAVVGKIGGRRLPLVAADLLKFNLGARRYAGPVSQLVRSEPPAPVQPVKSGPGPLSLMAKRAGRGLGRLRNKKRKDKERRNGRMRWFGKRRGKDGGKGKGRDHRYQTLETSSRKPRKGFMALAVVAVLAAAVVTLPQAALADGPGDGEGWSSDKIEFRPPQPVEGRRLFVERLSVTGDSAAVTLRAATDIDIRVRAFGGSQGTSLRFWGSASLAEGERVDYSLPLHGPRPSLAFSWEDTLGQAGAVTFEDGQVPYPLPAVEGELCDLSVTSLGWTPGSVQGAVESECVTEIEEAISLQTVAGHAEVTETALMDAAVTAITGTVAVSAGGAETSVPFVANGAARFSIPVATGEAIHAVTVDVSLDAALRIPMPPLVRLTYHPERVERVTRTVHLHRPGDSDSDSETATATCEDGATASATATAYAYVPSATIAREVTVDVRHPEHVKAETVERSPIAGSRDETHSLASGVGADDPFETLTLPEPEPEPERGEQSPAGGGLSAWFDLLGWEWPW